MGCQCLCAGVDVCEFIFIEGRSLIMVSRHYFKVLKPINVQFEIQNDRPIDQHASAITYDSRSSP